ncbi:MAG: InlB B-repeat-containing protein [Lachnospiraceae bacterium]|nr:InlB B-repeat-containing protein [Lachnospiraceae bacterium]
MKDNVKNIVKQGISKIIIRTVLIAAFGILFSLLFTTETKAERIITICISTNLNRIAVCGHAMEAPSIRVTDDSSAYSGPILYYTSVSAGNDWKKNGQDASGPLVAGDYEVPFSIYCYMDYYSSYDSNAKYILKVDGTDYEPVSTRYINSGDQPEAWKNYLVRVTVPYLVTYKVENGKWNDDTTTDKTERVLEGNKLTQIPEVGNKPAGGYREGAWDPVPTTNTVINANTTYTYTYAPIKITFDANGGSVDPTSSTVGSDGKLTSLPEPERSGFRFDGWFDETTSTETAVTLDRAYTGDTTLKAFWTELPVFQSASIDAPSKVVKGHSYNIPFSYTFDRPITDEDKAYVKQNCNIDISGYKSGDPTEEYNDKAYTMTVPFTIPSDATDQNLTIKATFDGGVEDTKIIPIIDQYTVTYKVKNGKWNDGSTENKTEIVADGDTLADIPPVGNKPDANYKEGSWSPSDPTATTVITKDTTYTYTYAEKETLNHKVTFKVKNGKWDNGSKGDITVTLTGREGDTLKLSADQIPAVGSKPDDGFKAGTWDTVPSTKTAITKDTTYTYDYIAEEAKIYTVTATDDGHGSAQANPKSGKTGTKVTITATPDNGYLFKEWKVVSGGVELADSKQLETTFNIKNADVEVQAIFEVKEADTYTVTATTDGHGTAKANPTSGKEGKKVTITAVSDAGYKFKKWKVVSGGVKLADAAKAKTTFKVKNANVKVKAIFEKIYEEPQPDIEPVDDDKIILAWFRVDEAKGYDIFMSRCDYDGKEITPRLIKTIKNKKTTQWTVTGLEPNKSYKALIKAYTKDKNGKKKYISKSPLMHVYTAGGTKSFTNAKSVKLDMSDGKIKKGNKLTLNVKDTYKIKASVKKADKSRELMPDSHVKTLRYRSSDPGVASVSGKGKITARKPGKCKIYVYAHNGVNKTINLTVK